MGKILWSSECTSSKGENFSCLKVFPIGKVRSSARLNRDAKLNSGFEAFVRKDFPDFLKSRTTLSTNSTSEGNIAHPSLLVLNIFPDKT